jgi:phosphate uptake regulator
MARANYLTADHQLRRPMASLHRLVVQVQSLLDVALVAFAQLDAVAARQIAAGMLEIEGLYQKVRRELLEVMKTKSRIANQAIYLSRSAYHLRRAAERVAAIADWVLFIVEGSLGTIPSELQVAGRPAEETSIAL